MLGVMRRSLGRLIGRKGRAFLSDNNILEANYNSYIMSSSDIYGFCSSGFKSPPFLHFSRGTHLLRENPKKISHQAEGEGKGVSREIKKAKELATLKKGDTVDLSDLLCTKNRDYLIKCKDSQRVKVEQLAGKVVVIYFDSVLDMDRQCLISLMHIYSDLQPRNNFEVVFVDNNDFDASLSGEISLVPHEEKPDEQFEDVFPTMPWTAVPLSDITSRKHLRRSFGIPENDVIGVTFVIDSTGIILQWEACNIFSEYGAPGYPFSDQRIDFLKSEDEAAVRQPSVETLLASPERDYLISSQGDNVPIHTLEDKVVALFFYTEGVSHQKFAVKLKAAYEALAKNDKKFEDHGLPIIGPHMEFIQPFGHFMLLWFGTPAYPFSYEKIAYSATEGARKVKLEMLWDPNNVFGGVYGSQVRLSQLVGKRVMILFDSDWSRFPEDNKRFLEALRERYMELKGTEDEFEVIHLTDESDNKWNVPDLPWFVLHIDYNDRYGDVFSHRYDWDHSGYPSLVAFDRDRSIVRKTTLYPTFEDTNFPFYAGGMEKEALSELITSFNWGWLPKQHTGTIYTYRQNIDRSI